jgi:hypothetical protein
VKDATETRRYCVYGLRVSSPAAIDSLASADAQGPVDCELRLAPVDRLPPSESVLLDVSPLIEQGEPGTIVERSTDPAGPFVFEFLDGTRFRIEDRGRLITASWPDPATFEDMVTYFLGPILAFVVRMRGGLALHAGAIVLDGQVLLVTGVAGAGKSTTVAAMVARGASMLSEDVSVIAWRDGRPCVLPGYARVRLWDDSAAALFGSAEALALLTPTWSKRFVDTGAAFVREPVAIRAIVVLTARHDGPPMMRRLYGHEAVMALLVRTSMTHLLAPELRASELEEIARVVEVIPVLEIAPKNDLSALDELLDVIAAALP